MILQFNRVKEYLKFSKILVGHITFYTIAQYGDAPDDQVEEWTPEQCRDSLQRYLNRFLNGRRGKIEQLRDLLKIAHYACLIFFKLRPTDEEISRLQKGE